MNSCLENQEKLKNIFSSCRTPEERYELIIALGKKLPPMDSLHKTSQHLVDGCQSKLYLYASLENGKLKFEMDSDALISKGLAAILFHLYNNEPPEHIIKYPPTVLSELNIFASLSPTRSHGLKSLFTKMQKIALQHLV